MGWQSGIDTIAHKTALEEKGNTIAVLGCGFNNIFPKENEGLYQQIIKNCGLIISEYEPNVEAESDYFLQRNRIVSGLSLGVLIIESAHRSGTSVTAKLAQQQGRKVFAIPHEIYNKHGIGNNRLIKEEIAIMVNNTEEIIQEISTLNYKEIPEEKILSLKEITEKKKKNRKVKQKIDIKKQKKTCENEKYNEIYKFITDIPSTISDIYKKTNKSISEINNLLLMLEIEGFIKKVEGGYVCTLNKE